MQLYIHPHCLVKCPFLAPQPEAFVSDQQTSGWIFDHFLSRIGGGGFI